MKRSFLAAACALLAVPSAAVFRNHAHEISRGGAWLYHAGAGPCGRDPQRAGCAFDAARRLATAASANGSVSLAVSNTTIAQLQQVTVAIDFRAFSPASDDWVGAYCVDDEAAPNADSEYIDYHEVATVSSGNALTFGPLVNMRCAWQFRYFTRGSSGSGSSDAYTKLATSPYVRFCDGATAPLHVHVAKTERDGEMRVMWVSANVSTTPFVELGVAAAQLTTKVAGSAGATYAASDMCEAPSTTVAAHLFRDPGVMFDTVLSGLAPAATYYYRVCSGENATCSATFKLKTPPAPGVQNGTASFFVYGDLGDWNVHATGTYAANRTGTTMELIRRDLDDVQANYVAVLHDGDLSYAKGSTFLWDQFGALIQPVASEIPYMVGVGNHEYDYETGGEAKDPSGAGATNGFHPVEGNYAQDSQGECGVPFAKRFTMPANGNKVFWWSTEIGLMHHTMISSEHDYTPGSAMYQWLANDLKSVDRTKTPWLFLHLHRPMYTSEAYAADHKVSLYLRQNLESLLGQYKVDAVFSGHYHAYELTCPVYDGSCRTETLADGSQKAKAPVHIMVGSAGADIDNVGYYDVPWRVAAQLEYGYGRVHVHNATHAQWEFVRNKDEIVASSTWIVSDHNWTVESTSTPSTVSGATPLQPAPLVGVALLLFVQLGVLHAAL